MNKSDSNSKSTQSRSTPEKFPVLVEKGSTVLHSVKDVEAFVVGRSQNADLPVLDRRCSRQQFQVVQREGECLVEPLSANTPTYCDGVQVTDSQPLTHGSIIQAGGSQFVFLKRKEGAKDAVKKMSVVQSYKTQVPVASHGRRDHTMLAEPSGESESLRLEHSIPLDGQMIIGRDEKRAAIQLSHPQVSRLHAQITLRGNSAVVSDLNSANGTYVNGSRIYASATLRSGDRIDVGPYALVFGGNALLPQSRVDNVELACRNLSRSVKNRDTGQMMTILDEVSLIIPPQEFVCLLGPSGSGKSTLLTALSARVPAERGKVTINGEDLYSNFEALKRDIAMVPQKDVLHEFLTVGSALHFTSKLRLPPDTTGVEVKETIADMLTTVGLTSRARTQIRHLSGGQLKRASLANEIVSRPSLLFLDEVTSGLDEQTDAEMMQLFRRIADGGKTVVCVTHSLAHVSEFCHKVVILAEGGKLAFFGTPAEALTYFEVDKLGEVYKKLASVPADDWKKRFRQSTAFKKQETNQIDDDSQIEFASIVRSPPTLADRYGVFTRQTKLLTARYLKIQMSDMRSSLMMLGQCLLVGIMIVLLFGDVSDEVLPEAAGKSSKIMFLLAISGFWFGCNNAAKEIVKERVIYERERDVNLLVPSYLLSKILLLGAVCLLQTVLLVGIVKFGTAVDLGVGHFILLSTLSIAGVGLGLLISAASQSTDMAVTIVPLVLIPQIIFSGAIANVEGVAWLIASLSVIVYWGYGGLVSCLPDNMVKALDYESWSFFGSWFILLLHSFFYLAVTVWVMCSGREPVYGKALEKLVETAKQTIAGPKG